MILFDDDYYKNIFKLNLCDNLIKIDREDAVGPIFDFIELVDADLI